MGHFHNPPPGPIAGATAAQPYGRPKLAPAITAVLVDNPPPNNEGRYPNPTPDVIVRAWQASEWPYVFLDKSTSGQPYGPPTFFTPSPVVVTTPYRNQWMASVIQAWFTTDPPPTLPRNLNPSITGVRVDNPPFGLRRPLPAYPEATIFIEALQGIPQSGQAPPVVTQNPYTIPWLSAVLQSWQPGDPPITLARKLNPSITAVRVDNPTPNQDFLTSLISAIQAWQLGDPAPTQQRKLSPGIPGQSVDNPPFSQRDPFVFPVAPDPPIQPPRYYPQAPVAVTTQGPYANYWLASILQQWIPADLAPTLPGKLNPSITAVRVDNPPFGSRFQVSYPQDIPFYAQRQAYLPQGAVVVSTQGPYANYWMATVLQAWQTVDPQPTLPKRSAGIPGWSVDNPPTAEGQLIISWLPDDAYPQLPRYVVQPFVAPSADNPPFTYGGRTAWMADIAFRAWQQPDPLPTLAGKLNPSALAVHVDNPPFSGPGRSVWLADVVVRAWQPPDPLPTLSGKLPPTVTAVRVDNPPFSSFGRSQLPGILGAWIFPPPQPTPSVPPPQVQPGPPPPPITAQFTVSGPDVSTYLPEFGYDVSYTDAAITKRTV